MPKKCVTLFSGGLDSLLVLRLMAMQGIETIALHSVNCFHGTQKIEEKKAALRQTALALGASDIFFPDITDAVVELTKNPRHGYGKHLNACIDCRLRTIATGFTIMRETGADFVASGEVVGQRPMSQRRDAIGLANREIAKWGFAGLFLRPLCAKLLDKTIPEREGWINSAFLYDISGRGRDRQMAIAQDIGVHEYPEPAGGCLLTDPFFSNRLAVMTRYTIDWQASDVELLKVGRHFQIHADCKIVVSRDEEENYRIESLALPDDRLYINEQRHGAIVLLRGKRTAGAELIAAGLAVHYSKMRTEGKALVASWHVRAGCEQDKQQSIAATVNPEVAIAMEMALTGGTSLKVMRTIPK